MSLHDQLLTDMKAAMREKNQQVLDTIRFLLAEIKNVEIDHGTLDEADIQKIVRRQIKQMSEVVEDFQKADRQDLIKAELAKIETLKKYLPSELSDAELDTIIAQVKKTAGEGADQAGALIGAVMKEVKGRADGSRVAQRIKDLLSA